MYKYRSNNDPDLEDDIDTQTILTANDEVKKVLNESKNVTKSLVKEIKEFVYPESAHKNRQNETFDSYARHSSSRLNNIKKDLDQYMYDFKNKEIEKSNSYQRINLSESVYNNDKPGQIQNDSSKKMNIGKKGKENINGNQNSSVIKFL